MKSPLSFYLFDHLGNTCVTFRADAADAISITYAEDYYPYGKVLRQYKECNQNRYLSTHHERDKDTGYDNRGARLYDSEIGRFLGVDPLASEMPEWSVFNYVEGNPIGKTDPDGRSSEDCCGFIYEYAAEKLAENGYEFAAGLMDVAAGMDPMVMGKSIGTALVNAETSADVGRALDPTGLSSLPIMIDAARNGDRRAQGQLTGGVITIVAGGKAGRFTLKKRSLARRHAKAEARAERLNQSDRSGRDFTTAGKDTVKELNRTANGGRMRCENCGKRVRRARKHRRGRTPPNNEAHVDHVKPKSRGGRGNLDNGAVLCRKCNLKKSNN